jgi:nitrate reductase beta subunit
LWITCRRIWTRKQRSQKTYFAEIYCPPSFVYPMGCKQSMQHHLRRSEHRH